MFYGGSQFLAHGISCGQNFGSWWLVVGRGGLYVVLDHLSIYAVKLSVKLSIKLPKTKDF